MQEAALERDHCGGGGWACIAFGIVALADYLGAGIKKAGETITDGVRQGAHWAGEKISEGVSAAKDYFSKGKKVRDKENHAIPPANQNSWQRQGNELEPEKPEIPDPSKLGEPGYMPPGNGGGGGNNNRLLYTLVVIGVLSAEYIDTTKPLWEPMMQNIKEKRQADHNEKKGK